MGYLLWSSISDQVRLWSRIQRHIRAEDAEAGDVYNSQSNGLVERGVCSLKHILNRSVRLTELQLHEILFMINAREQPGKGAHHQDS